MSSTSFDTIERLLENVLAEAEDPNVLFKVRTALQLVVFLRDTHGAAVETLNDADLDPDLQDQLAELGYID